MKTRGIVLLLISLILSIIIGFLRKKKYSFNAKEIILITFLTCIYGVIGVKGLFMLEHIKIKFTLNGFSFFGAVFFCSSRFICNK